MFIIVSIQANNLEVTVNSNTYYNFQSYAFLAAELNSTLAVFMIFVYLRALKLLRIPPFTGPAVSSILDTLSEGNFLVFMFLFILVVISFAIAHSLGFGGAMGTHATIGISITTMVRAIFGDFDYPTLSATDRILGPFFFITFMVFCGLLLINMLIAIISNLYTEVEKRNEIVWERSITKLMINRIEKLNYTKENYNSQFRKLISPTYLIERFFPVFSTQEVEKVLQGKVVFYTEYQLDELAAEREPDVDEALVKMGELEKNIDIRINNLETSVTKSIEETQNSIKSIFFQVQKINDKVNPSNPPAVVADDKEVEDEQMNDDEDIDEMIMVDNFSPENPSASF